MKFVVKSVLVFTFLSVIGSCERTKEQAPLVNNSEIDSFIDYCYEHGMFNGSVLVVRNDTLVYKRTMGFENRKQGLMLSDSSRFYLASVSKPFTALAIMQLEEAGKLEYHDSLGKYFDELPNYADSVTIRHVLTHTSGIPNHYDLGMQQKGMTNADVLAELIRHGLNFEPGTRYEYSNSGYILLAMIVERLSGMSFNAYMQQHVFQPLDMHHTVVGDETQTIQNKVIGTGRFGEEMGYPFFTTGAGGMYTTIDDLYRWEKALYTEKLVTQKSLRKAFRQTPLTKPDRLSDYGYGWHNSVNQAGRTERMFHTGGAAGYASFVYRDIKNKHAVIILASNGRGFDLGLFADALTGFLEGAPIERPKVPMALEWYHLLTADDNLDVEATFETLRKDTLTYSANEDAINDLGYHFLEQGAAERANLIFKCNTLLYPTSSNVYDSYAESYLALGNLEKAERLYLRSFELDATIRHPKKVLEELKKTWKISSNTSDE